MDSVEVALRSVPVDSVEVALRSVPVDSVEVALRSVPVDSVVVSVVSVVVSVVSVIADESFAIRETTTVLGGTVIVPEVDFHVNGEGGPGIPNTIPVITLLGNIVENVELNFDTYIDASATAFDAEDGDITGNIITVNPVDESVLGAYIVAYDVTDSFGSSATQGSFGTINIVSEQLEYSHDSPAPLFCGQPPSFYDNVQFGTAANDKLTGTAGNDLLVGEGGDDILRGLDGNDCLIGEREMTESPVKMATIP